VQPEGVHWVDVGPIVFERVSGPVVPVRRFQSDLGALSRLGHGQGELDGVVVHPHGAEQLAGLVQAYYHRAPAVQVDAHVLARYLFLHRGFPPLSRGFRLVTPECANTRALTAERGPRLLCSRTCHRLSSTKRRRPGGPVTREPLSAPS
jgi:hypothetical protein